MIIDWKIIKVLSTDYSEYGGSVERWADPNLEYPDCSFGCQHWRPLEGELGADWGVCTNANSPRAGLLTWEHQAGEGCWESHC